MTALPVEHPSGRRRRAERRATSAELVEAALRVIAREGVAATTTRRIADEAGVPLGTVHYWFADKNALLEEVVRLVVGRLEDAVASVRRADASSTEEARAALHAAWSVISADDPGAQLGMYELTALALRNPAMRELARSQYRSYRAMAARSLRIPGVVPEGRASVLSELVAVTFDGLVLAWLADPEGTRPREVLDLLAELVLPPS